jgi:probable F420-dependent oxidoreductase
MRETIGCLRAILAGQRSDHSGRHVRSHGFRLRLPQPDTRICVAAFGPAMTLVAARHADEVVLNLVPPERVRATRAVIEAEAAVAARTPPRLAVWVPVALEPGGATRAQLASQLAIYLGAPGYGEMFSELGFGELVRRARAGAGRAELARLVPSALLEHICALGPADQVAARVAAYHEAGADTVGLAPSTAEDPAGRRVLTAAADAFPSERREAVVDGGMSG